MEDFSLSASSRGRPAWSVEARFAFLDEGSQRVFLKEPRLSFFKDGRLFSQAKSKTGAADLSSREVFLSSSVVVDSIEANAKLETESLVYFDKIKKFKTENLVALSRPGAVMRGRGLEANADLSELRIYNQESEVSGAR